MQTTPLTLLLMTWETRYLISKKGTMLQLYSKKDCPNCVQAKKILDDCNVEYEVIMVDEDMEARSFLLAEGHRSLPQVYKAGKLFVRDGHKGLAKAWREGSLD